MKQITINKWVVEYDDQQTREFYKSHYLITEGCGCIFCKNYVEAINYLPKGVLEFLNSFGIDPRKEGEVSEYSENENGTHLYGGFYHIVGRLISGPDCWVKTDDKETHAVLNNELFEIDGITFGFTYGLSLLPDNFPKPAIQIEFQGNIPWVISERP